MKSKDYGKTCNVNRGQGRGESGDSVPRSSIVGQQCGGFCGEAVFLRGAGSGYFGGIAIQVSAEGLNWQVIRICRDRREIVQLLWPLDNAQSLTVIASCS